MAGWVKSLTLRSPPPDECAHLHRIATFASSFPNLKALTVENLHFDDWTPAKDGFSGTPPSIKLLNYLTLLEFKNCCIHIDHIRAFLLPYTPVLRTFKHVGREAVLAKGFMYHFKSFSNPDAEVEWHARLSQAEGCLVSLRCLEFGSAWQGDSVGTKEPTWFIRVSLLEVLDWTIRCPETARHCARLVHACRGTLKNVSILAQGKHSPSQRG